MSDEDKALFRAHMHTVKPLSEKTAKVKVNTTRSPSLPEKTIKKNKIPQTRQTNERNVYLSDFISETVLSETILSHVHPSLPSQQFRALRKGEIRWEAKLDLHGFKTEAARAALTQFIIAQAQNNKRCILIVHGKGGHQGDAPIIKNLVNRWLPQFDEILAFHSALPKDGGHGAVYVLLRRNKNSDRI